MSKPPEKRAAESVPPMPAWAADWITTPPEHDVEAQEDVSASDLLDEALKASANVFAALAGGAVAGIAYHFLKRAPKKPKPRESATAARKKAARGPHRVRVRPTAAGPPPRSRPRVTAWPPPPPMPPPLLNEIEAADRAAAQLLGVHVDAGAAEIGQAFRRAIRERMKVGPFHDQPGADGEAKRYIDAKNRLMERARERADA